MASFADGACGDVREESATRAAVKKATVVKKPKTFCSLFRAECMIFMLRRRAYDVMKLLLLWNLGHVDGAFNAGLLKEPLVVGEVAPDGLQNIAYFLI